MLLKNIDAFWFLLLLLQDSGLLDASTLLLDHPSMARALRFWSLPISRPTVPFLFSLPENCHCVLFFIEKFHTMISPRAWSVIPAEISSHFLIFPTFLKPTLKLLLLTAVNAARAASRSKLLTFLCFEPSFQSLLLLPQTVERSHQTRNVV